MPALKFHKVTSLPGTLEADAVYFVQNGSYAETYVTNSSGAARSAGNSAMINALADARIVAGLADLNAVEVVADITARNALATGAARNIMAVVLDATGDTTVASGSALYVWRESNATWYKLTEYESMDVIVTWASITGKPSSAASLIDDAVAKRHEHSNKTYLDKIGEASGSMTYDGQAIGMAWATGNW